MLSTCLLCPIDTFRMAEDSTVGSTTSCFDRRVLWDLFSNHGQCILLCKGTTLLCIYTSLLCSLVHAQTIGDLCSMCVWLYIAFSLPWASVHTSTLGGVPCMLSLAMLFQPYSQDLATIRARGQPCVAVCFINTIMVKRIDLPCLYYFFISRTLTVLFPSLFAGMRSYQRICNSLVFRFGEQEDS